MFLGKTLFIYTGVLVGTGDLSGKPHEMLGDDVTVD